MSTSTSEIFNPDKVKSTMEGIGSDFDRLSSLIQTINSTVTTALGSPDNAMYGDAGSKVLATWDENCSTLNEFTNIFGNWSSMVVAIGNEYGNLQEGTAIVQDTDKEAFQTIANANKSSWLKTEDANNLFKGSTSKYKDENDIEHTKTMSLKDGMVESYKDETGNNILNYSTLGGTLITSAINDTSASSKKALTDEDNEKVEHAKERLKESYARQYEEMKEKQENRKKELEEQKNISSSNYAIEPHSRITEEERARRMQIIGGETGTQAQQESKMVTIDVPYWDGNKESSFKLKVNNAIADNYLNVFKELTALKYTVKPNCTAAYDYYHTPRSSGAPSDHTLGTAIDLNWDNNWYTGDGSSFAVRGKEEVINAFAKQGFYWGGDWRSSKDDMHFSFTGF